MKSNHFEIQKTKTNAIQTTNIKGSIVEKNVFFSMPTNLKTLDNLSHITKQKTNHIPISNKDMMLVPFVSREKVLRHNPAATSEWNNSNYTYTKGELELSPVVEQSIHEIIKLYFNSTPKNIGKKKSSLFGHKSILKTYIATPRVKTSMNKARITVYKYDRQKLYYINMLNNTQRLLPTIILPKKKGNEKKSGGKGLVLKNPKGLEKRILPKKGTNVHPNGKVVSSTLKRTLLCNISNKTVKSRNVSSYLNTGKRLIFLREMSTSAFSIRNKINISSLLAIQSSLKIKRTFSSNKRGYTKDGDPSSSNPRKSSSKNGGKRSYNTCALFPFVIYPSLPKMLSFYNNTKKRSAVKYKKLSTIQYVSPASNKGLNSLRAQLIVRNNWFVFGCIASKNLHLYSPRKNTISDDSSSFFLDYLYYKNINNQVEKKRIKQPVRYVLHPGKKGEHVNSSRSILKTSILRKSSFYSGKSRGVKQSIKKQKSGKHRVSRNSRKSIYFERKWRYNHSRRVNRFSDRKLLLKKAKNSIALNIVRNNTLGFVMSKAKNKFTSSRLFNKWEKEFLLAINKTKLANSFIGNYINTMLPFSTIDYLVSIMNNFTGGLFSSEKWILNELKKKNRKNSHFTKHIILIDKIGYEMFAGYMFKKIYSSTFYSSILWLSCIKSSYVYLSGLVNLLKKTINKSIGLNVVDLKYLFLDSNIMASAITTKLKDRKKRVLRVLKRILGLIKKPYFNIHLYNKKKTLEKVNTDFLFMDKKMTGSTNSWGQSNLYNQHIFKNPSDYKPRLLLYHLKHKSS